MSAEARLAVLVRVVVRLEAGHSLVTTDMIRAALGDAEPDDDALQALLDAAVAELVLFRDRRTLHDLATDTFHETHVYRVNYRHPLLAAQD